MAEHYHFGRFALDGASGRLYADGVPVALGTIDARLLTTLIENAGRLVPKDYLVSRAWRGVAVTDNALYVHMNALRRLLGEDCIANKQGRGYRFVAQVQRTARNATRPLVRRSGNLPALESLSRLIGRREQLRLMSKLLARSRIVTVTGPGGVGKTKFAIHAANRIKAPFPNGIWFVELAGLRAADSIFTAGAAALGIAIADKANPHETLGRYLERKRLLIVLDNCEHVIGGASNFCEAILAMAPGVTILATSREPLGCFSEQILEIPPLPLPSSNQPDAIRATAAIEFFVERATYGDPNFMMTDADASIVSRICHRVDGLPLAIEMVAGWVGVHGLEMLEVKLDGFIRGWLRARSSAPARQSTLRATLEWSHGLLSEAEQTVLRRLAVFAGSFTLAAAEAVACDGAISKAEIFEHLANLKHKSMIAVVAGSRAQRFRLLETTRAFMRDDLQASGDERATRQRHAGLVLSTLETALSEFETKSDVAWLKCYGPILDDLRAALDWAMVADPDLAVALAGSSWPLWRELSLHTEGGQRLREAVALLGPGTAPEQEARLWRGLGDMWPNNAETKHEDIERAVNLYRALGESPHLGSALVVLGFSLFTLGRIEQAEQAILEAVSLLEPAGWLRTLARAYSAQLCIDTICGRFDAAFAAGEKAARLAEMAGADRTALVVAANLVQVALERGDLAGSISAGRGLAVRLRDTHYSDLLGFVLGVLSAALTAQGDLTAALIAAREAAPRLHDDGRLFWLFDHLALRAALRGRNMDAALVTGYANAAYEKIARTREPMGRNAVKQLRLLLHAGLPEEEIARLTEMGAGLSEEQALTLALND